MPHVIKEIDYFFHLIILHNFTSKRNKNTIHHLNIMLMPIMVLEIDFALAHNIMASIWLNPISKVNVSLNMQIGL